MKNAAPIYLIDARRSPIGRFGGGLKSLSAADLTLQVAESIMPRPFKDAVGQTILGQVLQAGSGMNVARQVSLRLGLPESSSAFTVNMACASGLKAVALAVSAVSNGETELVLAGGVEMMSRAPHYATDQRSGFKLGDGALLDAIFTDGLSDPVLKISMGETAERIAEIFGITRQEQDIFAGRSQARATASAAAFRRETVPVLTSEGTVEFDEHPRAGTTMEKLAQLKPVFREGGTVTAGNASGINDGAALVLVANAAACERHGLKPRARVVASCTVGCDPGLMGLGPVGAIRRIFAETGWSIGEVDAIEINEAFAAQTLACARQLGLGEGQLNQRGGAIALGHPIGASGARVLVTLLHIMEDLDLKRGIASLCVGGGMGIAMALER